jgi:hypothetical protein
MSKFSVGDFIGGILATAPHSNPAMRSLQRKHDEWLAGAELHVPYYSAASTYEWVWMDRSDQPRLTCDGEWTFVRRLRNHLVDTNGVISTQVFYRAAQLMTDHYINDKTEILTTRQPRVPRKPADLPPMIHGNLRDF